jgi:putative ABC transport system ATP-binding protein
MRSIIVTNDVDVTYNPGQSNEFKALVNINIEIAAREYIIFFGPSGCGKSTLLYSIFGVLAPTSGKVVVKGDSIYDYEPMDLVMYQRKTMGIMYQQFNLIPSLTVLDNVQLPLIFAGLSPSVRERRAMDLLERYGIAHVAHKRPALLSGGQQQRVSVARSLVNDPEILIADEPVGNLDAVSAEAVMNTLEEINQRDKKTVLLVTHDAKYLPYAHRVFYLDYGRVDRIVPNPEKRQIIKVRPGETIVTEIEQLARIYPYDSPDQLRVKSLINFLTQNLSFVLTLTRVDVVSSHDKRMK